MRTHLLSLTAVVLSTMSALATGLLPERVEKAAQDNVRASVEGKMPGPLRCSPGREGRSRVERYAAEASRRKIFCGRFAPVLLLSIPCRKAL